MFGNTSIPLKLPFLLLVVFQLHCIFAQSTYRIATYQTNWFEASEYCHRMGMRLIIVDSEEKHNDVVREANVAELQKGSESMGVWIGATDLARPNVYIWHNTGIRLRYTNWAAGEPTGGNEHCLELQHRRSTGVYWRWNDIACDKLRYAMCENVDDVSGHRAILKL